MAQNHPRSPQIPSDSEDPPRVRDVHPNLTDWVALASPQPHWQVLDVATGTGVAAFAMAPHVDSVFASDLSVQRWSEGTPLARERKISSVRFCLADAHRLPFPDDCFDCVTCRRAPHHFSQVQIALAEMRRVLREDGSLLIDDRSVPEISSVATLMDRLDVLHDRSHVQNYPPSTWKVLLHQAGFVVRHVRPYTLHRPITALTEQAEPRHRNEIERLLNELTPEQREAFQYRLVGGVPHHYHWFVQIYATARPYPVEAEEAR